MLLSKDEGMEKKKKETEVEEGGQRKENKS